MARTGRLLTACGFALTIAAAPTAMLLSAAPTAHVPQASCAAGEESDVFSGDCQPILSPNTSTQQGPDYSGNFSESVSPVNGANPDIPEIDGIPCTGGNSGQCIGLSENQAPNVSPHSTVSSSP
jgi:hypothetical protein